jgi:ATP-dependent DNA helicase Rep/DNA helicase-2/ATP-dependent DNA helicase PcrA
VLDLADLNREQLEAVVTTEGPLLVLAGAGSGKTRVITYRLAHLIEKGLEPERILAVTFTNKAAFEMKDRARRLVGGSVRGATISTFHALGVRILRKFAERVGLRPKFTICDGAEQLGTMRRILRALRIDDRRFDAKRLLVMISAAKNAGLDAAAFRASDGVLGGADTLPDDDEDYRVAAIEAYEKYESALKTQNLADFDDLLLLTVRLLASEPDVLALLRDRWHYLMIDEYQDTNGAQFELMRLLAGERRNLCVVGDDDQSIYGWRGADVRNILRFGQHFPGARTVKLETNYRSTGFILEVANAVIAKNPNRYDKRLRPALGAGDRVKVVAVEDEDKEADQIGATVLALTASGVPPDEIAVLFRSNIQSRPLELALRAAHVPYRVVGGMELFDKKEIKDVLAYIRLLENPDDEQSLLRIVNFPPRGIGDKSVEKVDAFAREHELTLAEAMARADEIEGLSVKTADAIADLMSILSEHSELLGRRKPSTVVAELIEAIGLEDALLESSDDPLSADRRIDNVKEIVRQIERYEERSESARRRAEAEPAAPADEDVEDATLDGFLRDLALSGFEDGAAKDDRKDQVVLSTIHAAKGLEWKHVFLAGAEEELLPHKRTIEGDGEIGEERRLTYVAITRARQNLTISWAENRTKYGKVVERLRSRFLEDLPEDAIEVSGTMKKARTEEELRSIELEWRKKIRAQLGISKVEP